MRYDKSCVTMAIADHNNGRKNLEWSEVQKPVSTLGDLNAFILQADIKEKEKKTIRLAIRRADQLIGHGVLDVAADAAKVMSKLERLSPAMAGMTKGAFANLKSRVRKAFRLAKSQIASVRSRSPLEPPWRLLQSGLATREQRSTSRFLYFASNQGWLPQEVTDAHIDRFVSYLREEALVVNWDDVVRNTIKTWNKVANDRREPALAHLTPSEPKRTSYWVELSLFRESLRTDIAKFLSEIADPPLFGGRPRKRRHNHRAGRRRPVRRKLKPGTVEQYRFVIVSMVSALAAAGVALDSIASLQDLVSPGNLNRILTFMHRRTRERATSHLLNIAVRGRRIAEWCDLPDADLEQLDEIVAAVKEVLPRKRGMTAKNKELLDRLDDPRFRDLIYLLPMTLVKHAQAQKNRSLAARIMRTAVAIELLLMCSMRRGNLVPLELDKSIRKLGNDKNAFWVIDIAEEDVKTEEPLRFQLPNESAALLEEYLVDWRPLLCPKPTPWLFPDADGDMIDERKMTSSIQKATRRVLGVPISTHQFRHIASELHLYNNPEALGTVSQHLGHRDFNTTRTYYARNQQRQASRRYQDRVILDRSEAVQRTARRSQRRSKK